MMRRMLGDADIEAFHRDGFVAVRRAFPREVAEACLERLRRDLPPEPHDQPVIRLGGYADPPFLLAAQAPPLQEAFDQLLGPGTWVPLLGIGTFPVRFPSDRDPGDAAWHLDGSYDGPDGTYWVNHRSRGRALLLLLLFSDVTDDDAPTAVRVGSHTHVGPLLEPAGEDGMSFFAASALAVPATEHLPVAHATGEAGDVFAATRSSCTGRRSRTGARVPGSWPSRR